MRPATEWSTRPEFQPGAVERGSADEPEIANLGADWSHEVELRATVDRTEFRQLQRIRVVCRVKNVAGQRHFWVAPCDPNDRYLGARVRVFDTKGKLVPMTEYYRHEGREPTFHAGGGAAGGFLSPGQSFRKDLIPNLIYDMTRPGEYWILVEMAFGERIPPGPNGEELFYVRANPIKIRVTPEITKFLPDGTSVTDPDRP